MILPSIVSEEPKITVQLFVTLTFTDIVTGAAVAPPAAGCATEMAWLTAPSSPGSGTRTDTSMFAGLEGGCGRLYWPVSG